MVNVPPHMRTEFVSATMEDVRRDLEAIFTKENVEENIKFLKSLATKKYVRKSTIESSPQNLVRHAIKQGYVVKTSEDRYTVTEDGRLTAGGILGMVCYAAAHKRSDPRWSSRIEYIDRLVRLIDKK